MSSPALAEEQGYLARARRYPMRVTSTDDDPPFLVAAPDWPGLIAGGHTPEEALSLAVEVVADMIERNETDGRPVPTPSATPTGRLSLRVSRSLHSALAARAEAEGVSVSYLASELLASGLGVTDPVAAPRRREQRQAARTGPAPAR